MWFVNEFIFRKGYIVDINAEQVFRVLVMLLGNRSLPMPVDAIWFHGRSHGDEKELIALAAELFLSRQARYVFVNGSNGEAFGPDGPGTKPQEAWAGFDTWHERLAQSGVATDRIIRCKPSYHTRQDAEAFLEASRERGFRSGVVIAHPHQLLRAWLADIRVLHEYACEQKLYAMWPRFVNWSTPIQASQGQRLRQRFDDIHEEFRRLAPYMAKGDIATLNEAESYLKNLHACV